MVCVYCAAKTKVTNSRSSKKNPGTWRRRECLTCGALFTTRETADLSQSHLVAHTDSSLEPFLRDNLYMSVYESCRHRKTVLEDAEALTGTIIAKLLQQSGGTGKISTTEIKAATQEVLQRFDTVAVTYYQAYYST